MNEVINFSKLENCFYQYDKVFTFSSSDNTQKPRSQIKGFKKALVVIGPEGGFSQEEETILGNDQKTTMINLPTPILRAPHALSAAVGFLLGCLNE